jgi:hypothetical protein
MAKVLTDQADLECPHSGRVTIVIPTPLVRKLTIGQRPVLVKADLAGAPIVCAQPPQTIDTTVSSITAGEATKLTVRRKGVLLDGTLAGQTDKGAALKVGPLGAGQAKVKAI